MVTEIKQVCVGKVDENGLSMADPADITLLDIGDGGEPLKVVGVGQLPPEEREAVLAKVKEKALEFRKRESEGGLMDQLSESIFNHIYAETTRIFPEGADCDILSAVMGATLGKLWAIGFKDEPIALLQHASDFHRVVSEVTKAAYMALKDLEEAIGDETVSVTMGGVSEDMPVDAAEALLNQIADECPPLTPEENAILNAVAAHKAEPIATPEQSEQLAVDQLAQQGEPQPQPVPTATEVNTSSQPETTVGTAPSAEAATDAPAGEPVHIVSEDGSPTDSVPGSADSPASAAAVPEGNPDPVGKPDATTAVAPNGEPSGSGTEESKASLAPTAGEPTQEELNALVDDQTPA